MNLPTLPRRKQFCYFEFAGIMIVLAAVLAVMWVMASIKALREPEPQPLEEARYAPDHSGDPSPEEWAANPCDARAQMERMRARDNAARVRSDAEKGGGQ